MARRPSGRLPVDRAKDYPETAPTAQKGLSTEGLYVTPMTDERLWDARMAVTFVNKHPERFGETYAETSAIAEVFFALGLAEPQGVSEAHPAVPKDFDCPTCDSPKGTGCLSGDGRYMRFHIARTRLAENAHTDKGNPTDA